jgi:hypothetical protein
MADATQELMLRVRGDNSGADKAIASTKTAVEGLNVSGEKAAGAFKNFSRSLAEARDASAVAASAADSLSNIVGKSLMGAFAVGGIKLFTDQINRMGEDVKSVATSAQKAFDDIEKAGQAMSLSEATNQVAQLDALLASTSKKLSDLDRSPFQNFIAGATGARVAMEGLVGTSKKLRDMKLAEGLATENANAEFTAGLDEQALKIAKVNAEYEKRSKIAQTFTDKEAYRIYQEASAAQKVRETNAIIDDMAQKAAQEKQKNTLEQIKLNQDLSQQQIKAEEELAEAQQKRFNELYDAEIKSQDLMQKRINAELKAAQELADKQKALLGAQEEARSRFPAGATGQMPGVGTTGGRPNIPGITTDISQRPTSAEVGGSQAIQRAYLDGIREATAELRQYIKNMLEANGLAHDEHAITNELIRIQKDLAKEKGKELNGIADFLKRVKKAAEDLYDFNNSTKEASKATTNFKTTMAEIEPSFDQAVKSATNLADSITKNTGDLVKNFLTTADSTLNLGKDMTSTGSESNLLGKSFTDLGKVADNLTDKLDKDKKDDKGNETLEKIHKLLDDNLKEMRTYAHVK